MTHYYETKAQLSDSGWYVEFRSLNWSFIHYGPRETLEAEALREVAMVTGEKDFGLVWSFV